MTPDAPKDQESATLTLGDMDPFGDTVAQLDGEAINVFGGIPGEHVVCDIFRYRRRGKRRVSGIVTEVLAPSPHRVAPPCPYFGACTGCQWQHITYPHQIELKREAVERQIGKYPELADVDVSPTVAGPQMLGYRNHARFSVRRQGSLGFINRITRRFVTIDHCMLMDPGINEAVAALQGRSGETSKLSIRVGSNTGDRLVQPALMSDEIPLTSGQTHYKERLLDRMFRVASPSFFQVNTAQAESIALMVRDRLELTGSDTLVDAYAGVGTFAVLLASSVGRVIAIEESDAAMRDAAINTLGVENLVFRQGKTEDVLGTLGATPDALIVDPPRAGCQPPALDAIVRWKPRRTVYVSCDPETLARDLQVLVRGGLRLEKVEPVDMFPQTYHVECVATLSSGG